MIESTKVFRKSGYTKRKKTNTERAKQITRVAEKLVKRATLKRWNSGHQKALRRKERKRRISVPPIVAFDLETTRIQAGTPRPLFLTAYTESTAKNGVVTCGTLEIRIRDMDHLREILETYFLVDYWIGARFVAWNANGFDSYFIAAALLHSNKWIIRPYLTKSKALRGLRVVPAAGFHPDEKSAQSWEFLDGMAMTGLMHVSLATFLKTFAPEYHKLEGVIDWSKDKFNPKNAKHVEYAIRDSVGLYHGMVAAEKVVVENFNERFAATIGNTAMKILKANIPEDVEIRELPIGQKSIVARFVMRGGYCFCVRKYEGPIWKYDINQAYAAAMREALLPCGASSRILHGVDTSRPYIVRLVAWNEENKIPFYYKPIAMAGRSDFGITRLDETWITSIEHAQLIAEGWGCDVRESYVFDGSFRLKTYVDKLESLRKAGAGGVKGAQGTMVKYIGNNGYGKFVERLDGIEIIFSRKELEGFSEFYLTDELLGFAWYRIGEALIRDYHQPQLGAFITAHVRMVLRRTIATNVADWLYADTDCAIFSSDNTARMDISPTEYGKWKIETDGEMYRIITKKVYASHDGKNRYAKGMSAKNLTPDDFAKWFDNDPPEKVQIQRASFPKVMSGEHMYRELVKRGTKKGVKL